MSKIVHTHNQIVLLKREQKLDKHLQSIIERTIIIKLKDAEIDIAAAQTPLEYIEADRNALELHRIDLILTSVANHKLVQ